MLCYVLSSHVEKDDNHNVDFDDNFDSIAMTRSNVKDGVESLLPYSFALPLRFMRTGRSARNAKLGSSTFKPIMKKVAMSASVSTDAINATMPTRKR